MNPLINIAVDAARAAGRVIAKAAERPDLIKVSQKTSPRDIVTDVDKKAEETIIQLIKKAYPHHAILAEESGEQGVSEIVWIIDPLDGTTNFAHNFPHYCVSIAIQIADRVEHGVVYDPIRDELFTASFGRGAQLNGRRIRMPQRNLEESLISATYPLKSAEDALDYAKKIAMLASATAGIRRTGSSALDLAYLAAGRIDLFFGNHLKIWDYAASTLIIHEAGGLFSNWQGGEVSRDHGQLLAAHPKLFKQVTKYFG